MLANQYPGRHYESGTICNALLAVGARDPLTGQPYSEALALGASGGIAFGYFVFEYSGMPPMMSILTRNTFSAFERALDNLAIRREVRETVQAERAEANLRKEIDLGNAAIVWADVFSMPYRGLSIDKMWHMQPLLVVGYDGNDFLIVDGQTTPVAVSSADLARARGRVKKDRFRLMILEAPDESRIPQGLSNGMETCHALFLDKPPAGSANNFGIKGMRQWAKLLREPKNPKSWAKTFEPGPRLALALGGRLGQPGVWDWIETWGTGGGADRRTFAQFLCEAAPRTELSELDAVADMFCRSATHWHTLAEAALPDELPEFKELKSLKRRLSITWHENGTAANDERAEIRSQLAGLNAQIADGSALKAAAPAILEAIAEQLDQIIEIEEAAFTKLRSAIVPRALG